jgi:hypothetical protein
LSIGSGCFLFFMGVLQAVIIRYLCGVGEDKEASKSFLNDFLQVFFCNVIICLELLFMFIYPRCNVSEVSICAELQQWLEPL